MASVRNVMTQSKHDNPSSSNARGVPELREDFRSFDRDHDGRINLLEFIELMQSLDPDITDEEALIGFREIDANHDGGIDLHEFLAWWTVD